MPRAKILTSINLFQNYAENTIIYKTVLQITYSPIHSLYKCIEKINTFKGLKLTFLNVHPQFEMTNSLLCLPQLTWVIVSHMSPLEHMKYQMFLSTCQQGTGTDPHDLRQSPPTSAHTQKTLWIISAVPTLIFIKYPAYCWMDGTKCNKLSPTYVIYTHIIFNWSVQCLLWVLFEDIRNSMSRSLISETVFITLHVMSMLSCHFL